MTATLTTKKTIECLSSCWAFEFDYYGVLNWFTANKAVLKVKVIPAICTYKFCGICSYHQCLIRGLWTRKYSQCLFNRPNSEIQPLHCSPKRTIEVIKKDPFDEIYFTQAQSSSLPGATAILSLIQLVALASRYAGWLAHQNQHFQETHLFLAFHGANSVLQILMHLFPRSYILKHLKSFNWALFFTKPSSEMHLEY